MDHPTPALSDVDTATVEAQLGRPPRGAVEVAHRCPCGRPDVVATAPRLPGGSPFPTTFYLTCPRASSACSTLESNGVMAEMQARLREDPALADAYTAAHEAYLASRRAIGALTGDGDVPEIDAVSAGGMPDRVKCLHALAAHALAAGPGVNPFGDETLQSIGAWWQRPCLSREGGRPPTPPEGFHSLALAKPDHEGGRPPTPPEGFHSLALAKPDHEGGRPPTRPEGFHSLALAKPDHEGGSHPDRAEPGAAEAPEETR